MMSIVLPSFVGVDLGAFARVPILVLFDSPADFKGRFVARLFDLDRPTRLCCLGETFGELKSKVPGIGCLFLSPDASEDACIIGTLIY